MAEKRTGEFASETIICTFADDLGITINFVKMITKKNNNGDERIRDIVRKMVADKRAVSSYIREHGSLSGFNDDSIQFSKPL